MNNRGTMKKKKLILWLLVIGLGVAGWRAAVWYLDREPPTAELLINRVWIERVPTDPRDMIRQLVVLQRSDRPVGVAARNSRWKVTSDLFLWKLDGDHRLSARFPENNQQAAFDVKAWRCTGKAPAPFELCLELRRGSKTVQLFSREDWVVTADGPARGDRQVSWMASTWDLMGLVPSDDGAAMTEAAPDWLPFD
jgi:hypothetical protein